MNVEGRSQERGDTLYTIYSGGDDSLFCRVLGPHCAAGSEDSRRPRSVSRGTIRTSTRKCRHRADRWQVPRLHQAAKAGDAESGQTPAGWAGTTWRTRRMPSPFLMFPVLGEVWPLEGQSRSRYGQRRASGDLREGGEAAQRDLEPFCRSTPTTARPPTGGPRKERTSTAPASPRISASVAVARLLQPSRDGEHPDVESSGRASARRQVPRTRVAGRRRPAGPTA